MPLTIRQIREGELDRVKQITVEAFEPVSIDKNIEREFGQINGRDWGWRKARHLDFDAEREWEGIFVAESDDELVGYITTWTDVEAGTGFIPNLAVIASRRGEGIGRKLIRHALNHFRKLHLSHARIETLAQNQVGQSLYPSLGFVEVARQVHYCMKLEAE